ncbi:MAG: dihydroxyacetone kinase subunit L [Trueperaceae bacterium]|nr:dihydroxyacetone kinase subunit L [Trueperaceae bacterium]
MTADEVRALADGLAQAYARERDVLAQLDAATGDGDHGAGMARGFDRARAATAEIDGDDVGAVLTAAGRGVMSGVGGASGALFASLFLALGAAAAGATTLETEHVVAGCADALSRIARLGRAEIGDKTMLDALAPALDALRAHADDALADALAAAALAAREGAVATVAMCARHGRARYAPEAGVGHVDPGAVSMAILFETWHDVARGGAA